MFAGSAPAGPPPPSCPGARRDQRHRPQLPPPRRGHGLRRGVLRGPEGGHGGAHRRQRCRQDHAPADPRRRARRRRRRRSGDRERALHAPGGRLRRPRPERPAAPRDVRASAARRAEPSHRRRRGRARGGGPRRRRGARRGAVALGRPRGLRARGGLGRRRPAHPRRRHRRPRRACCADPVGWRAQAARPRRAARLLDRGAAPRRARQLPRHPGQAPARAAAARVGPDRPAREPRPRAPRRRPAAAS